MKVACIDTSVVLALAFNEPSADWVADELQRNDVVLASNVLAAEVAAACVRERVEFDPQLLKSISWVLPDRPLEREIAHVASTGYVRGADLWHLATALFLRSDRVASTEEPLPRIAFVTLDTMQREAATRLGFITPVPKGSHA